MRTYADTYRQTQKSVSTQAKTHKHVLTYTNADS